MFDLIHFDPKASKGGLPVKWDAAHGFYVAGLKVVPCGQMRTMLEVRESYDDGWLCVVSVVCVVGGVHFSVCVLRALCCVCCGANNTPPQPTKKQTNTKVIRTGMRHRRVGSHQLNMESSRSHAIMTIYADATPTDAGALDYGTTRFGKISFVDLAGSERVKDSGTTGVRLVRVCVLFVCVRRAD